MTFLEKIQKRWRQNRRFLCVGLDPNTSLMPPHLANKAQGVFLFNKQIIDATHDLVCAYKPQFAYYAALGIEDQLLQTIEYIRAEYDIPVILDAKRNDIGATSQAYAEEAFVRYQADAVTVNPYMGGDTLKPFLSYADRGVVVLCKTSNPGSEEFQDLLVGEIPLYEVVAQKAVNDWNTNDNVLLVVGATKPQQLARVRQIVGDMPLLIPGIGAQGGSVQEVLKYGLDRRGEGLIISASRSIIYASNGEDFATAARQAAQDVCDTIGLNL